MTNERGTSFDSAPDSAAVRQTRMFGEFFVSRRFSFPDAPDVGIYASPAVVDKVNQTAVNQIDADRISSLLETAGRSSDAEPFTVNFYPGVKFISRLAKKIPAIYLTHRNNVYAPIADNSSFDTATIERRAINYQLKTNPGFWKNVRLGSWGVVCAGFTVDTAGIANIDMADNKRVLLEYGLMGISLLGFGVGALKRKITTDRIISGRSAEHVRFTPKPQQEAS